MKYQYKKVDAFTTEHSLGNPAACVYLKADENLNEAQMLSIGKAHKHYVSEVAICKVHEGTEFDYDMRYYSSECEVDFCGHGTIACMYSLIKDSPELIEKESIAIRTQKGVLKVYNEIPSQDAVFISAPQPRYYAYEVNHQKICEALRIKEEEMSKSLPIEVIDAGLKTLIIPLVNLKSEVATLPDRAELEAFVRQEEVDIILIYSEETEDAKSFRHTRVFSPKFGYLEDPATGSGNSAFGYYLLKHHFWEGEPIRIEQGNTYGAFNEVCLMTEAQGDEKVVLFGGKAKERIEGFYLLEE